MTNAIRMDKFDPEAYWQERGGHFDTKAVDAEVAHLKQWLGAEQPESLLDVGSGYGYLYLVIRDMVESYRMVDFVESMRQGCLERTGILPGHWDGHTLPYEDNSFDIVLSYDVLLHVPPKDIDRVFAEHVRVTKRWLYIATNGVMHKPMAPWCFWYDYMALFGAHGVDPVHVALFRAKWTGGRGFGNTGGRIHWVVRK